MGACNFEAYAIGKDAKSAFLKAREEAQWESGHGGYTGTIAEKDSFIMFVRTPRKSWGKCVNELMDMETGNKTIDDKWGPAGCMDITKEIRAELKAGKRNGPKIPRGQKYFVFFGMASC